jgi:hypothetical protein
MILARTAEERLILAKAALIKAEESRERKAKLRAERKGRGTASRGRETDSGFLAYVRRQPCEARHLGNCDGPIEAAHVRYSDAAAGSVNPGMQRKNHDRHCNPLCRFHHQSDQHKRAEKVFWARLGVDAYARAAQHYAAYKGDRP